MRSPRVHRRAAITPPMPVSRIVPAVLTLGYLVFLAIPAFSGPAFAADQAPRTCLNKAEQRAAVADNSAIPLAQVIKALRGQGRRGEVVRASLCRRDGSLVYLLTLLARSGKVTHAAVDARNGELINRR